MVVLAVLVGGASLPHPVQALGWLAYNRLTSNARMDQRPDLLQAADGRIWAVWDVSGRTEIYYQVYHFSSGWGPEQPLTSDSYRDSNPSITQLSNGTIFVAWSSTRRAAPDLYYRTFNGVSWSEERILVSGSDTDEAPSLLAARDGSLWVVWQRNGGTNYNLYYKTSRGPVWSADEQLTSDPSLDWLPSIAQMKDGRIWVVWSRYLSNQHDLLYKVFDGSSWGPETRLTTDPKWDWGPDIIQDRNGAIWIFWSRTLPASADQEQDEIFYKVSYDNGATWPMRDVEFTFDQSNANPVDDQMPTAVQASDKRIWLMWQSDLLDDNFELYYAVSDMISAHDLGVTTIGASPLKLPRGSLVYVSTTLKNFGDYPENFLVSFYANSTLLASQEVALPIGGSTTLLYRWNTSTISPGRYFMVVRASSVAGETPPNTADNTGASVSKVHVLPPGDLDSDGDVDVIDLGAIAAAYGTRQGDLRWNPNADLDHSNVINIIDVAILARWYGTMT